MTAKISIIICILLLMVLIYLIMLNQNYAYRISKQYQEIEALTNYTERLQEVLKDYQTEKEEVEIPKTLKIRELLDSYLSERSQQQLLPDNAISTEELRQDLSDFQLKQRFIPNIVPIKGSYVVSKKFSANHKAVDFASSLGIEVVASASGVVKSVYEDKYFGNVIVIDHLNHYVTFYAHLTRIFPQQGFFVEKGETIGLVGSSGFSTNPHLHYEVLLRGNNIDPAELTNF